MDDAEAKRPDKTDHLDEPTSGPARRTSPRARARVEVVLFALFLTLPAVGYVFGWNDFTLLAENRRLSKAPAWPASPSDLRAFPSAFERHFDDHFGFPSFLVRRDKRLEWLGRRIDVEIQIGLDDWLFEGDRQDVLAMTCPRPSGAVLDSWLALGRERQTRFEEAGIAFFWAMAPNKHSLYPERLPDFAHAGETRCAETGLGPALAEAGVSFLDLHGPLAAAATAHAETDLYHATDTHWNQLGAAHGVEAILEAVRARFPAVPGFAWDDYEVVTEAAPFEGNLAIRLRVYGEQYEEPFVRLARRVPARARRAEGDPPVELRKHAREDPIVEFSTGIEALPTAWVFHDSFGFATMELLAEHFESVRFVNSRARIDPRAFDHASPDLVLALFVEAQLLEAARSDGEPSSSARLAHQP